MQEDTIGNFRKDIESGEGCVVIMAGSDSDKPHIEKIVSALDDYGMPSQVRVCSAHKQPGTLANIIEEYDQVEGLMAYVAVAGGRGDDVNLFVNTNPRSQKGSSTMPQKDAKGGNPTAEEQAMSCRNYLIGLAVTGLINCEFPYARNLSASANTRINFEDGFKFLDHTLRRLASTVYWIGLGEERSVERVTRSFGVVTSQQVMNYLTDPRRTDSPMSRSGAHDLTAELATQAWDSQTPFIDVLLGNKEVTSRLDGDTLRRITDPLQYVGQSREIIESVASKHYKKRTSLAQAQVSV
jgi:argininosuccinate lyase